jgi:hypothetical protein
MEDTGADLPPDPDRDRAVAAMAEQLLNSRRLRNATFRQHLDGLGEPGWEMLLSLFIAASCGRSSTHADELIAETAMADEIVRPYILWLASQRLVEVSFDRVALTPAGRTLMVTYLEQEISRGDRS